MSETQILDRPQLSDGSTGFGRCPVCEKELRPRCKVTGEPRNPPVGTGFESRAKCGGCGTILYYQGGRNWGILQDHHLTADDHFANMMGF